MLSLVLISAKENAPGNVIFDAFYLVQTPHSLWILWDMCPGLLNIGCKMENATMINIKGCTELCFFMLTGLHKGGNWANGNAFLIEFYIWNRILYAKWFVLPTYSTTLSCHRHKSQGEQRLDKTGLETSLAFEEMMQCQTCGEEGVPIEAWLNTWSGLHRCTLLYKTISVDEYREIFVPS